MGTASESEQTQATPGTGQWLGTQDGQSQEWTIVADLKPGGADALREVWRKAREEVPEEVRRKGLVEIGNLHDARSALINNDTQFLFASVFDGDWDAYIDEWVKHPVAPVIFDALFGVCEGYPGMKAPDVKAWFAEHGVVSGNFVSGYPDLTVQQIWKDQRVSEAFQALLDAPAFRTVLDNPALKPLLDIPEFQALLDTGAS